MHADDDLLPISGLQHLLFCERQCALIHLEGVWADNRLTVEGTRMHRTADGGDAEARGDLLIVRSLPLESRRLGLTGRADVVEFRRVSEGKDGAVLEGREGRWLPMPVEYKRGWPKGHRADEVQLCAQGLCLEEMFGIRIEAAHLYYGARKRRSKVAFDLELRRFTAGAVTKLRNLFKGNTMPSARYESRKCDSCSLKRSCLPEAPQRTKEYLQRILGDVEDTYR